MEVYDTLGKSIPRSMMNAYRKDETDGRSRSSRERREG